MQSLSLVAVLTVAAFAGAVISAVFGMGGGITLLAIMAATSLDPLVVIPVHGAVQMMSNGVRVFAFLPHVRWRIVLISCAVATPCPLLGLELISLVSKDTLRLVMGVAIVYATWAPKWGVRNLPFGLAFSITGFLAGTLGVVIGATGPLIAPFYLRDGIVKEEIIATKAVCQMYAHLIKLVAFSTVLRFEFGEHVSLIVPMAIAVILGTFGGRHLLRRFSEDRFRLWYRLVLSALAIRILWTAIAGMSSGT